MLKTTKNNKSKKALPLEQVLKNDEGLLSLYKKDGINADNQELFDSLSVEQEEFIDKDPNLINKMLENDLKKYKQAFGEYNQQVQICEEDITCDLEAEEINTSEPDIKINKQDNGEPVSKYYILASINNAKTKMNVVLDCLKNYGYETKYIKNGENFLNRLEELDMETRKTLATKGHIKSGDIIYKSVVYFTDEANRYVKAFRNDQNIDDAVKKATTHKDIIKFENPRQM